MTRITRAHASLLLASTFPLFISGCGEIGAGAAGDFGATQGGVQDMQLARELIAAGQVPPPDAFTVEGMFSEHDLPLAGPACTTTLCLRAAAGLAPDLDGEPAGWMQVGLSSTIDPQTFERPSLTIVATVDVSGSMGWNYGDGDSEYPTPGLLARELLHRLAGELGPDDRLAIVTYGSDVDTPLGFTAGDDRDVIRRAIDDLDEAGSTNMEAGLDRAFGLARDAVGVTDETRVMLFTDVQPNVGATGATAFERMTAGAAEAGVGLTVFGLGVGLGPETFEAMSHLRGGNAFSFTRLPQLDAHMDDEWPWFVSPIAHDLQLKVASTVGTSLVDSHGFPGATDAATDEISLEVATVFLSRRKGALLVRIGADDDSALDYFDIIANLSYATIEGERIEERLEVGYRGEATDERGHWHAQPTVAKTVALSLLVEGMRAAAAAYEAGDRDDAEDLMARVVARIEADAAALADEPLTTEAALARALARLIVDGAPQGTLYP